MSLKDRMIILPDGYNGAVNMFIAAPVDSDGHGGLKLRRADNGGHAWISETNWRRYIDDLTS